MNDENFDLKLKKLIVICKESKNFKKLAVVVFMLISNRLDEIGVNLAIRVRRKKKGETIVQYMDMINSFLIENVGIPIFQKNLIELLEEHEPLFLRNRGVIPYDGIKILYQVYFELRALDVPNLHKQMGKDELLDLAPSSFQAFLTSNSRGMYNKNSNNFRPLILQRIKEKQFNLKRQSQSRFNSHLLEMAISLKRVEKSLESNKNRRKIKFKGQLKENLSYQRSIDNIVGHLILGVILMLLTIGFSMFFKLLLVEAPPNLLSYWSMILIAGGSLLLTVYIKYFIRRRY